MSTTLKTLLETKIKEYNFSNPGTPLTQKNINLAININKLRKQREYFRNKPDVINFEKVTKELFDITDNNEQARFFADMIKN